MKRVIGSSALTAAAFVLSIGLALPETAIAQTATDLKCKGCVGAKDLGKKAVKTKKIRDGAVTSAKIQDGAVTSAKIQNGAVTSAKIQNGAVMPADLHSTAKPSGAAFSELNDSITLYNSPTILRQVVINAPSSGIVIANASANAYFTQSIGPQVIYCTISMNPNSPINADDISTAQTGDYDANADIPLALVRAFKVEKGINKIYFLCREISSNYYVYIYDPVLVAFYVPGIYGTAVSELSDINPGVKKGHAPAD